MSDPLLDLLGEDDDVELDDLLELLDDAEEVPSVTPIEAVVAAPPQSGLKPRLHCLDVPWEDRSYVQRFGAYLDPDWKRYAVEAAVLPPELLDYASRPYSWERWLEDDWNGSNVTPPALSPATTTVTLRPHQVEAVDAVVAAHAAGHAGFLIADETGIGKTYEAVAAALRLNYRTILVLCPKSVIPAWRLSIPALDPQGAARWCVINYDRAKSLLEAPQSAVNAKRTRTKNKHTAAKGVRTVEWDLVIKDEAHLLGNPQSQRSAAVRRLDGEGTSKRAWSLYLSATAGTTPLGLSYLSPILTGTDGTRPDLEEYEEWCRAQGIAVTRGAYGGYEWERNPEDLKRMNRILYGGTVPIAVRRSPEDISGWPRQQRVLVPVEMSASDLRLYNSAWTSFREELGLARRGGDSSNPMVRQLRFRQKASLLRAPYMVEHVRTALDQGYQVAVYMEFIESIEAFRDAMGSEDVAVMTGQVTGDAREAQRLRFQRGEARVIAYNITTGINLQAGEAASGGNSVPRTAVVDPTWRAVDLLQNEGRTHRDGQHSLASYCYAEGTKDKQVLQVVLARMSDTKTMQGDDVSDINAIEAILAS